MNCRFVPALAALILSACLYSPADDKSDPEHVEAGKPIYCVAGAECDRMWAAALEWVEHHSNLPVRSVTDSNITTDQPPDGSGELAYGISKSLNPDKTYRIVFGAWCDGSECPGKFEAKLDFTRYVRDPERHPLPYANTALGVTLLPLTVFTAPPAMDGGKEGPGLSAAFGPVVATVDPGSPADVAAIHPGDRIVECDGEVVADVGALQAQLGVRHKGSQVILIVLRNGERLTRKVALG